MSDRNGEETGSKRPLDGGGDPGHAKRARPSRHSSGGSRIELRLLIPISAAGAIIGKGGSNIRDMREKFNASIQIPDSHGVERVVNTSGGNSDDLSRLCGKIVSCVNEGANSKNQEVRILVHKSQAGTIIGMKGFKIKELREKTGAAIKVFQVCCPNSTDRICQVRGSNEVIIHSVRSIIDLLETAPPKGPIQKYDPNNFDESYEYGGFGEDNSFGGPGFGGPMNRGGGMFQGGGGGGGPGFMGSGRMRGGRGRRDNYGNMGRGGGFGGGRGGGNFYGGGGNDYGPDANFRGPGGYGGNYGGGMGNNQQNFPGGVSRGGGGGGQETTTKVTIPTSLAGSIIGRGGSRIRQIRQDCGAQIKIEEPLPGSNDRIITITGTQEQIQNAQYLLQRSVKMYSGEKF